MELERKHKEQIEKIIAEMNCPKGFACYKSGFSDLCCAKSIAGKTFVKCLEENPQLCEFAFPFGYEYFCKCPLRLYAAENIIPADEQLM